VATYQHGRLRREIPRGYKSWVDIDWEKFGSFDDDEKLVPTGSLITWTGKIAPIVDEWELERRV
jgi:hypothetical protein